MLRRALLIAITVAVVTPTTVRAQPRDPDQARAQMLYAEGRRHYDARAYRQAIAAWKEGFALASAPMFLFNIGQAYRLAGDCEHAAAYYARYKQAAPVPPNAAELAEVEALCADNAPSVDETVESEPADPEAEADVETTAPAKVTPQRRGRARRTATLGLGATGVVATGAGLVFGARAYGGWNEIETLCGSDRHCDDETSLARARTLEEAAESDGTRATVLVGVGVAAIAGAVILHVTRPDDETARDVRVIAAAGGGGMTVFATGRF